MLAAQPADATCLAFQPEHDDPATLMAVVMDTLATTSDDFMARAMGDLANTTRTDGTPITEGVNAALATIAAVGPRDEMEAQLAIQMAATHAAAMRAMSRLGRTNDPRTVDSYGNLATKMLRTYTTQIEALAKLRRGGEQKVRVEHVHVYEGGQAIVGSVLGGGTQGEIENGRQPHAHEGHAPKSALAAALGDPLLCDDTSRDTLPVTRGRRQGAVPHARRRQG